MGVDLQKVDAEITALRSRLSVINDDLDECRLGYFEHPWAWSLTRWRLTSERHRVQRRLDEIAFVRKCVGERQSLQTSGGSEIVKALGIGRASVYRVLDAAR